MMTFFSTYSQGCRTAPGLSMSPPIEYSQGERTAPRLSKTPPVHWDLISYQLVNFLMTISPTLSSHMCHSS